MGYLINKNKNMIHMENCSKIKKYYKSTKNKKDCNYDLFKTKKAAENYFIQRDKEYKFCKSCFNKKKYNEGR